MNILSVDWFIETCKTNEIADYKAFCVYKNALNSVKTPKKKIREERPTATNISVNISFKSYETDINDCLSQYIAQDNNRNSENVETPKIKNEVKTSLLDKKEVLKETNANKGYTTSPQVNNQDLAIKKDGLVFKNKNFEIIGFDESDESDLKGVVSSKGGHVLDVNDDDTYGYSTADFTIFPLTLNETTSSRAPVTLFWLQKCIESNRLVAVDDFVLYQPIPRFNSDRPLVNCVITISGYVQQERTMIASLCDLIGAKTQNAFSCKPSKDILPNTHLICKTADGPKYKAAKDWRIPTVCVEWLVESCVYGVKADEAKHSIDTMQTSYVDFIQTLDKIRRNLFNTDDADNTSDTQHNYKDDMSTLMEVRELYFQTPNVNKMTTSVHNESKRSPNDSNPIKHSESKKPRLSDDNNDPTIAFNNSDDFKRPQLDRSQTEVPKPQREPPSNPFKTPTPIAKTPTVDPTMFQTPPCNKRLVELKRPDAAQSTTSENNNSSNCTSQNSSVHESDFPTPVWLKNREERKNFEYRLNVDADYIQSYLASIETPTKPGEIPQTPIQEVFTKNMAKLAENMKKPGFYHDDHDSPQVMLSHDRERLKYRSNEDARANTEADDDDNDLISATPLELKEMKTILKDVKVFVTKKLIKNQVELNAIIESLG